MSTAPAQFGEPAQPEHTVFCALHARQSGESLLGKAANVQTYLLIEDPQAWAGFKAMDAAALSPRARASVKAFETQCAAPRVQFIKNRATKDRAGRFAYLILPAATGARLRRYVLPDLDALGDLDLVAEAAALAADDGALAAAAAEPIVLVCTNGKKDMCCAKFGGPTYAALDARLPHVWECTHTGGDRFAGNVVLPVDGHYYGFVLEDGAAAFADSIGARSIPLKHFRGRTVLTPTAQAAEGMLRHRLEAPEFGRFALAFSRSLGSGESEEVILDWATGRLWRTLVHKIEDEADAPSNCTKGKTVRPWRYDFTGWRALSRAQASGYHLHLHLDRDHLERPIRPDDLPWLMGQASARAQIEALIGPMPANGEARERYGAVLGASGLRLVEARCGTRHLLGTVRSRIEARMG